MPALTHTIRSILVNSLLSLTISHASLVQAEDAESVIDEKFMEHLIEAEGMRSLEVNGEAVTNTINSIVISNGKTPNYLQLLNSWKSAPEGDPKKVILALGMFSAGISNNAKSAIEFASLTEDSFFDNDFKLRITENNLAGDSYSWLIDHVDFTVPKALVEHFPKIVSEDTPYWGGTRDGYFNIEDSSKWGVFSSNEHREWLRILDDIESPDKEIWRGSIRNTSLKSIEIFRGLLAHNPNYLIQNISNYAFPRGEHQWLNYWRFSGAYEYVTHERYQIARTKFYESLKQQLLLESEGDSNKAETLANLYIDVIEMQFTGHSGRSERAETIFNELQISKWSDLVGKHIWKHTDEVTLRMVGGMLLLSGKEGEFISYTHWLVENDLAPLVGELIGLASMSGKLTKNIVASVGAPIVWGAFNKTPLMYSAHFDDVDAYNKILKFYPDLPLQVTTHGEEYGELPKIGDRNVLMYALENARLSFINKILNEDWVANLNHSDSANRDYGDYLDLNEQLTEGEKAEMHSKLKSMGLLVRPKVTK